MAAGDALSELVAEELSRPVSAGAQALARRIRELHGAGVRAVLFYGSCLRRGEDFEGVLDLYALVDDYRTVNRNGFLALLNRVLPPNVFYIEVPLGERRVRCKYALLSRRDLLRRTTPRAFEPYFWARFAQPCALVWAADEAVRAEVVDALTNAVLTMVGHGLPLVAPRFTARELWTATWRQTYRSELRAERAGAGEGLWESAAERYEQVTPLALAALSASGLVAGTDGPNVHTVTLPEAAVKRARRLWGIRRVYAKSLFLLRIARNALIFEGGVDYALWKIHRHSGVEVDYGWRERRFPLLALAAQAWRLFRRGAFR